MTKEQKEVIKDFLTWFEDNFGDEEWYNHNAEWERYLDLPEYVNLKALLNENNN